LVKSDIKVTPRPYQLKAVESLASCTRGIVHAPTGSGKTNIIAYLIDRLQMPTLVIVPASDLVTQSKERFENILDPQVTVGNIDGNNKNKMGEVGKDIIISTWQSLAKNRALLEAIKGYYRVVIVDECHHASADVLSGIIMELAPVAQRMYGVSATPYRSSSADEERLMRLFNYNVAYQVSVEDLYNDGFLIRPTVDIITVGNYSLAKIAAQSFIDDFLEKRVNACATYDEFIDKIFGICYHSAKIMNQQGFGLITRLPNGAERLVNAFDINNYKAFLKKCNFNVFYDDMAKKMWLRDILVQCMRDPSIPLPEIPNVDMNRAYEVIFNSAELMHSYGRSVRGDGNWLSSADIGVKIGFLKKCVDNDRLRRRDVESIVQMQLRMRQNIKAVMLTNTIKWSEELYDAVQNSPAYQKVLEGKDIQFFYLNGSSKNKTKVFDAIRKLPADANFILVSTTNLIKEGIDLPNLNVVFQMSPVFNPINAIYTTEQLIGRAIRPSGDKRSSEIFIFDIIINDFNSRRKEVFEILKSNLKPKRLSLFYGVKNYIANVPSNPDCETSRPNRYRSEPILFGDSEQSVVLGVDEKSNTKDIKG